ncbi:MAG: cob(I)yrinic acid a,c-diamide adenosyltransferase [Desulfobacteraceae bacterium]|uniref:Cob(I)yrinic acid a,c-diamide adenosyltransferase n=1 Tax=Candidatus Desulfacyla euxinica TaxID=2841693 RepID=A0A8J6T3V8_9DELT|nr:cob(I)yrinic acid a,c-diamide adenosyltransferase [Candidatus Desulfacyla euxinica]MBL6978663.1 cob(I)yrinic acid a,c-diamide adenosyltransferase [Desulfobacteraceae bacterium]MBL7217470.1 cob(I)yrinic acid a,c-diamide adenosyltransferase [Desulfobacteraceae bacterium]
MLKGYIQIYTGNGKGKTTAAFGLALRAVGAGLKVYIAQFVKGAEYSELESVKKLSDSITLRQYGLGFFVNREPNKEDIRAAREGLKEVRGIMCSGGYDLVILDEANVAVYHDLFSVEDLLEFMRAKPENVELVITGRRADPRIIESADLVTEMKEIKHYYHSGVEARIGIEK